VNDARLAEGVAEFSPSRSEDAFPDLVEMLSLSEAEFRERFAGRALLRAKYAGLLRNACVVLGNLGDARACGPLSAALDHPQALVRGHAAWALGRLAASTPLHARLSHETDPWVREEITEALESVRE
jgi:epoxyqueuosine reductase